MNLYFFEHKNYNTTQNPKYLVMFLHGYGSNGANLIDLSHEFQQIIPQAHFISPNAPQNWEGGFVDCYQWFSLANWGVQRDISKVADDVRHANTNLRQFIKIQLNRFNLGYDKLFLAGFSQGAMMAMYQGLTMPEKPAGVISFSGKLILPELTGEKTITKPEICLMHGKKDSVLPFSNFIEVENLLKQQKIPFEAHAFDNLDHTIDIHGVKTSMRFIEKILG